MLERNIYSLYGYIKKCRIGKNMKPHVRMTADPDTNRAVFNDNIRSR